MWPISNFGPHGPLAHRRATMIQAACWASARKNLRQTGPRATMAVHLDRTTVRRSRLNKPVPGQAHNPSTLILHSHLLALSTIVPHRATRFVSQRETIARRRNGARGAVRSPSLACAPTVGWTRHRRVASRRCLFAPARTDEVASAVILGGLVPEHTSVSCGRGVLLPPRH
jgi:hypothetical protein